MRNIKYKLLELFGRLKKSTFLKSIIILSFGAAISQFIPIAISPILSRLFTAENFGVLAIFSSLVQIISVFVSGKYEMAINLPKSDEDAFGLTVISALLTSIASIFIAILLYIFRLPIVDLIGNETIGNYIYLLPIGIFIASIYNTLYYWINRNKQFKDISMSKVTRGVTVSLFSILFGVVKIKTIGLVLADLISQVFSTLYFVYKSKVQYKSLWKTITIDRISYLIKRYKHFPIYSIPSSLLSKLSAHLPVLLMSGLFGTFATGIFSLSQRVIASPSGLIASASGDVFRQKASEEYAKNGSCTNSFMQLFKFQVITGILPFGLIFILAPFLFEIVFGAEWKEAGTYTQILSLMYYLQYIVSPLSTMFIVAEEQFLNLVFQAALTVGVVFSFYFGHHISKDPKIALYIFSTIYSIKYVFEFYFSYKFSKGYVISTKN